jgi:diaminopimelate epimerase
MLIPFRKYQGTGNDFVMIDNRNMTFRRDDFSLYAALCDRHRGIGADGVILLQNHPDYDFEMVYVNADGRESTMCGNGGRCIVQFAADLYLVKSKYYFLAIDGPHEALLENDMVHLHMQDVPSVKQKAGDWELNTGSPHYVSFIQNVSSLNVVEGGKKIRHAAEYDKEGINVNFAERQEHGLFVRTFERGVEDETLSCGTGVTAAALSLAVQDAWDVGAYSVDIDTPGGALKVSFELLPGGSFRNIWLIGPALEVFAGEIDTNRITGIY